MNNMNDPYLGFNFLIEIDGLTIGAFSECSGFGADMSPIEYRAGSEKSAPRKLPGMKTYSKITFKRGIAQSMEYFNWKKDITNGTIKRRDGIITLFNEDREPVRR